MTEQEHRPILDPSVLGRMASSMESIKEAWESDVEALHAVHDELATTRRILDSTASRLDDAIADNRSLRDANVDLIQKNARLEAQLERIKDSSLDASEHLATIASRADFVPALERNKSAPLVDAALKARAQAAVQNLGRHEDGLEDDGRTPGVSDIPMFLRADLRAKEPHRTNLAPNEFGRATNR